MMGVGISLGLFAIIRMFARPAPSTMTKEYQEMTNEYLKVRSEQSLCHKNVILTSSHRPKTPNRFQAFLRKVTMGRGWYKAGQHARIHKIVFMNS